MVLTIIKLYRDLGINHLITGSRPICINGKKFNLLYYIALISIDEKFFCKLVNKT